MIGNNMNFDSLRHIRPFFENLRWYGKWLFTSRDFDYHWLLEIIQLWLKKYQKHNNECSTGGRKEKEIYLNECINLIQAIMEDDWCKEEEKAHNKKWGKLWTTSKKIKDKDLYQMNFHRKNVKTKADKKQERKERVAIYNLEEKRRKKAINRFFHLFKRKFQSWWC